MATPDAEDGQSVPRPDFARLARQIADWTTKGLFSALVIVGGLGFGRQVIRWWHDDETAPAAAGPMAPAFELGGDPVEIAAGDSPMVLGRQTVIGDEAEAAKTLRARCLANLAAAAPMTPAPDAGEQKLLGRLAELEPSERLTQADARLYEPAPGMPLVVGVRRFAAGHEDAATQATASKNRVVLWGLAAPRGEAEWTLYEFRGSPESVGEPGSTAPLPPDCRRIMALRDRRGAETVAFQGTGGCDAYRRFYQTWQIEHWPQASARWRRTDGGGWLVTIDRADEEKSGAPQSIVIHLAPGPTGGCTGLVFVSR